MSITKTGKNQWLIDIRIYRPGQREKRKRLHFEGTRSQAEDRQTQERAKMRKDLGQPLKGSLTASQSLKTFSELIDFYRERKGDAGMTSTMNILSAELGAVLVAELPAKMDAYIRIKHSEPSKTTGKLLSNATINRFVAAAKMICGFCCKRVNQSITGLESNPLSGFEMEAEEARDRVWTNEERTRLFATMQKLNSHLYWAVYFSQWNPIRKNDLFNLTRENLDRVKPWVHFYPMKTRKRKNRESCLVCIDEQLLSYWDSLPADCPYLFPRIDEAGNFHHMGDPKRHWATLLRDAGIEDFRFHDLKHCSITYMLDNGFTERDLKNLGIQYSSIMIDRYYSHNAEKGLQKWKQKSAAQGGTFANSVHDLYSPLSKNG